MSSAIVVSFWFILIWSWGKLILNLRNCFQSFIIDETFHLNYLLYEQLQWVAQGIKLYYSMLECSRTWFCLFKLRAHHCISCCSFYWQSLMHSRVFIWIFIACNRCSYSPDVSVLSQPRAPGRHKAGREFLILEVWILQWGPQFLPWNHLGMGSKPDGHVQNLLLFHFNSSTQNPFQDLSSGFINQKDELYSSSPKNALRRGGRQEQEPNHHPNTVKYICRMVNLTIWDSLSI